MTKLKIGVIGISIMAATSSLWVLSNQNKTQLESISHPTLEHANKIEESEINDLNSNEIDEKISNKGAINLGHSPYLRVADPSIFKSNYVMEIANKSIVSYPIFREDLTQNNLDFLFVENWQSVQQYLKRNGYDYDYSGIVATQKLEFWSSNAWFENQKITGHKINATEFGQLLRDRDLKISMGNPAISSSSYASVSRFLKESDETQRAFINSIKYVLSHDGNTLQSITRNESKTDGLLLLSAHADYYQKIGLIPGDWRPLEIETQSNEGSLGLIYKSGYPQNKIDALKGQYQDQKDEFNSIFLDLKIEPVTGFEPMHSAGDISAIDKVIGQLQNRRLKPKHTIFMFASSDSLSSQKAKETIVNGIIKYIRQSRKEYPWAGIDLESERFSLMSINDSRIHLIEDNRKSDIEKIIWTYVNSLGRSKAGNLDSAIIRAMDYAKEEKKSSPEDSQIFLVTGESTRETSIFAKTLEKIRSRTEGRNYEQITSINSILIGDFNKNNYHSMAGLTGGSVRDIPLKEKSLTRALIRLDLAN